MRTKKCCFFFFFFFTSTSRDDYKNPTPNFIARSLDFYVEAYLKTLVFKLLSGPQSFLTESCCSYFFLSQSPSDVNLQYIQLNTTLSNTRARETFHCPRSLRSFLWARVHANVYVQPPRAHTIHILHPITARKFLRDWCSLDILRESDRS